MGAMVGLGEAASSGSPDRSGSRAYWWRRLVVEFGWVGGMFAIYNLGRLLASKHTAEAFRNADDVWDFERTIRLPDEQWVQELALRLWTSGVEFANFYYATVHFPLTIAFLIFTFFWRPAAYLWARRSLVIVTTAALFGHFFYPLAPPRMLDSLGFIDTGHVFGMSVYSASTNNSVANQFAAMPSLHVGWAMLIAVVMIASGTSRWRWLWIAHPAITIMVVTVTANHYWLDGIVALMLLAAALMLARIGLADPPPWPWQPRTRSVAEEVDAAESAGAGGDSAPADAFPRPAPTDHGAPKGPSPPSGDV